MVRRPASLLLRSRAMARSSPLPDQEPSTGPLPSIPVRLRRRRRIPLLVKVVLVVAAVVGLALLFAQDQETLHIKSAVAAEDPAFPDYVASLTGSGITRGDEYQILVNGVQIFPAMLDAIRHARRRINFETYIYDTGQVARGVHVRAGRCRGTRRGRPPDRRCRRRQRDGARARRAPAARRRADWHVQPAEVVLDRGDQLPDAPQDPRGGWRRSVHRRRWRCRPLAWERRRARALARHAPARNRARRDDARSGLLRELGGDRAHRATRASICGRRRRKRGHDRSWSGARRAGAATA